MFKKEGLYRVLLPNWVFEARDKDHFKQLLSEYMKNYPDYVVKGFEKPFALCERRE